ncbi:hypothetical protein [Campylobacter canadensis]|uniref:3-isopropylmalate dehydratase n=1 Tax=Campylobacter canadensis TaxID=449520 RepID=A0ABS7WR25_9BACT|nr:hypothetical protein [Campylobacter canadensis]MBZ7986826.1 hypothetical protein [Campylobacter canadensis]MBZ7995138.1 hypothetical protein [Campylobacter canadensis]MBZ7996580.1 hypothetical protein [Campylobacter canadensis]MBZ7997863.1 hypothetical protein [Campylobacter canadensis]MBZ8000507.1 hypothetical protein [Campylobacter canadensis]
MQINQVILPFIHIIAGVCFVGLHLSLRINAKFYLQDNKEYLKKVLEHIKIQFYSIIILMIILALSAIFMFDYAVKNPIFHSLAFTQWLLYAFIGLNLAYMYYQFLACYKNKETLFINEKLTLILYYFVPLNLLVSCIGILFALIISVII